MSTPPPRLVVLTPRQRAVLGELTRDGADNPTIATRLGLSEQTVKTHMRRVMAAFGATTRTGVVVDCLRGRVRVRVSNNQGRRAEQEETA